MKTKAPERRFVTLQPEAGKNSFLVTWTPAPNDRRRLRFPDVAEATAEANRLEALLVQGHDAIASIPRWRLVALNALCAMLPQDSGASLHKAIQFYVDRHGLAEHAATAEEVGLAFIESRSKNFSDLHLKSVRVHVNRFIKFFGKRPYALIEQPDYTRYLVEEVGGAAKSQNNHLITLKAMSRWARDTGNGKVKFLPIGQTAAEQVQCARVTQAEHVVYTPDQFMRLLVHTSTDMVPFMVLGQFAGVRAAERCRMNWHAWRKNEDNKLVLGTDITKTKKRRRVDVPDNLGEWLAAFHGEPDEMMVPCNPYKRTLAIAEAAGVPWIDNALRAGYASYHLELFDNAALTAKNDGHSVSELENSYKSISGVTKKVAREMFAITPQAVLAFARAQKLPTPEWAKRISK